MKSTKLILAIFAMFTLAGSMNAQTDPAAAKKGAKVATAESSKPEMKADKQAAPVKKRKEVKVAPSQAQAAEPKAAPTVNDKGTKPEVKPATDKPKVKKATAPAEKQ